MKLYRISVWHGEHASVWNVVACGLSCAIARQGEDWEILASFGSKAHAEAFLKEIRDGKLQADERH